jgi:hypothetical protein
MPLGAAAVGGATLEAVVALNHLNLVNKAFETKRLYNHA